MNHPLSIVLPLVATLAALCGGCSTQPAAYSSPDAAVDALVTSLGKPGHAGVDTVLGDRGAALIHSGDDVEDNLRIREFLAAYDERHQLVPSTDDELTLVVGPSEWPMPIPLRRDDAGWRFDVAAGEDEILSRRIGRNELTTIQVLLATVDAQGDYAASGAAGAPGVYAARFMSTPGTRDGLYWPSADGQPQSPLGPLVAEAAAEGYTATSATNAPRPFHGYLYRILTSQGPSAPGGAMNYVRDGRMTGGFAVIAAPVRYGSSGIMTFLVSRQGVVYQADLGDDTERTAAAITSFDPDARWSVVVP